jgi:hypothetical protein
MAETAPALVPVEGGVLSSMPGVPTPDGQAAPAPEAQPTDTVTEVAAAPAPALVPSPEPPAVTEPLQIDQAALERMQQEKTVRPDVPARPVDELKPEEMKVTAASAVGSGKLIDLRAPDGESVVLVTARTSIRARLVALEAPPARLPEGMAAFTDYIGLDREPPNARVEATLKLVVSPKVCAPENLDRLKLYGYRPGKGWAELKDFRVNAETRSLSAIDQTGRTLRVYAVLGPEECRLAQ